jgi:hypothetical protein
MCNDRGSGWMDGVTVLRTSATRGSKKIRTEYIVGGY